jgi:hypothetical protein
MNNPVYVPPDRDTRVNSWKHDYLHLEDEIEAFQQRRLGGDQTENVAKLLDHYLDRCRELLWAEVNGGLEETYDEEVKSLNI